MEKKKKKEIMWLSTVWKSDERGTGDKLPPPRSGLIFFFFFFFFFIYSSAINIAAALRPNQTLGLLTQSLTRYWWNYEIENFPPFFLFLRLVLFSKGFRHHHHHHHHQAPTVDPLVSSLRWLHCIAVVATFFSQRWNIFGRWLRTRI